MQSINDRSIAQDDTGEGSEEVFLLLEYIYSERRKLQDRVTTEQQGVKSKALKRRRSALVVNYSQIPVSTTSIFVGGVEFAVVSGKCKVWFESDPKAPTGYDVDTVYVSGVIDDKSIPCQLTIRIDDNGVVSVRILRLQGIRTKHGAATGPSIRE